MKLSWKQHACRLPTVALAIALGFSAASAADKTRTFTGEVSDAMCGAQHMMTGSPADCTRACLGKGSKYAFVVGDKVYTLDSSDKKILDALDGLAGKKATLGGISDGDTIKVISVAPVK
jgi:hypothetical protein